MPPYNTIFIGENFLCIVRRLFVCAEAQDGRYAIYRNTEFHEIGIEYFILI